MASARPAPPFGTGFLAGPLRRLGVVLPPELLALLRYGRGVDNRRLKEAGFRYAYTSAGTVQAFAEGMRLRKTVGTSTDAYKYEPTSRRSSDTLPSPRRPR